MTPDEYGRELLRMSVEGPATRRCDCQGWKMAALVGWIFVVVILAAEWGWIP